MNLIVGLGNPGEKYINTRHNVGFRVVYSLAKDYNIQLSHRKFKSIVGRGMIANQNVLLAEPLTYMNNSGDAVKLIVNYYKIPLDKVLIIYDDLDLPTGKIRVKKKGSAGGHNGLKSIIDSLGSIEIPRVRIGINRPTEEINIIDYVLGYFNKKEERLIEEGVTNTIKAVNSILKNGIELTMNRYN